jgi:hypothetical protein
MIKVHTSPNAVEIHNLKNVLEGSGIDCEIRGEYRRGAVGEIPVNECWIELWIVKDSEEAQARQILDNPKSESAEAWNCSKCGESNGGQFDQCWKCQDDRPADVKDD